MVQNVQCPVCTLYLHAGMSLTDHLETHPKEQVIKALVQFAINKNDGGEAIAAVAALSAASVKEENEKNAKNVDERKQLVVENEAAVPPLSYQTNYVQQETQQTQTIKLTEKQLQQHDELLQRTTAAIPPPPPPPRSPVAASMQHAYAAALQPNHQHTTIMAHHPLQQQQSVKILPWSLMPIMQPPLQQLISYQAAAHATPHQKPPPAYVTAISQIRSQHNNQNKHIQQQQHEHDHQGQGVYHRHQQVRATNGGKNMYTQQQQQHLPMVISTVSPTQQQEQLLPQYENAYEHQQYNDAFNNKVPSQNNETTAPTTNKHFAPPVRPLSRPQSAFTPTLRQSNSPYPLTTPSPAPSVLRYAESPVAHYLERDNGDFIVQETPKHIVECVETDDGDFAVTEKIYQSPPSVLQMHFDDEDEENKREENIENNDDKSVENDKEINAVEEEEEEFLRINSDTEVDEPKQANSNSKSKRTSKNSITVLSDVQLNLNEYLDLMGNIIASSKINGNNKAFCNSMELRRIKVEKEDYYDEDYEQQQEQMEQDMNASYNENEQEDIMHDATTITIPPKKLKNNKNSNNNKNKTEEQLYEECNNETNLTKNENEQANIEEEEEEIVEHENDIKQQQTEDSKENYAETSVIRMATTSQKQQQQQQMMIEKCVAEDLSQQNKGNDKKHDLMDEQKIPPTTTQTAAANLPKKGPKKLIIKPKSAKTEQKITTTNDDDDDEKPTTSAAAAAQIINLQKQIDTALKLDMECIVKHETVNEIQENIVMDCKPEEIKLQRKYVEYTTDMKMETDRHSALTEDARMLYEFAHSKKHKAAAAAAAAAQQNVTTDGNFLSTLSIFSKVNNDNGARSPSLRCDDEFMPAETLNYSTNVEQPHSEREATFIQQQQHHTFADYPFSFLYGANAHNGQGHGNEEMPRFGNFSPALYHQHPTNDGGGGTTAATLASGSNSLAASFDDSSSKQQQQQQQQQNFNANHWYQQQTLANADFETALAVELPDTEGNKYLDLDGFCKRESSPSYAGATNHAIVVANSATSSSFAGATDSSLAGGDALNIRTDEKMPAKGEISEQESNCDIENSWSQPMYGDFPGRYFKNSFPSMFQQDNGWHQDEYFAVQDLSAATNSNNKINQKK